MAEINANPEVMRYFPGTQSRERTLDFIERQMTQQRERGYCYFAAEHRQDQRLIGFIGISFQDYEAPYTPATDIGWRLHPDYWGQGLATEGARECLAFAFGESGLEQIVAVAVAQNAPSLRVMEKIGMTRRGSFDHPYLADYPHLKTCVWYSVIPQNLPVNH